MIALVQKTLDIYLRENRVITQLDFPGDVAEYMSRKDSVFVTLYHEGRVIASSGRIAPLKDNTVYECIDNTLLCLKDARFPRVLQDPAALGDIHIRVDIFSPRDRRILQSIDELDTSREGIIFLSESLGALSIILPHMMHVDITPTAYLRLVAKKAGYDIEKLQPADYVLYAIKTTELTDMM